MEEQPDFEQLCRTLCELLGDLETRLEQRGTLRTLRLAVRGLDVFLLYAPEADPHTACLIVALGSLAGDELQGWQKLLEANHSLRGACGPRFARDPQTNEAILQHAFSLDGVAPDDVQAKVCAMANMALDWKQRQMGVVQ